MAIRAVSHSKLTQQQAPARYTVAGSQQDLEALAGPHVHNLQLCVRCKVNSLHRPPQVQLPNPSHVPSFLNARALRVLNQRT